MYTRERDSDAVRGGLGGSRVAKLAKRNPLPSYIFIITLPYCERFLTHW